MTMTLPGNRDGQGHANRRTNMGETQRSGRVREEQVAKPGPSSVGGDPWDTWG